MLHDKANRIHTRRFCRSCDYTKIIIIRNYCKIIIRLRISLQVPCILDNVKHPFNLSNSIVFSLDFYRMLDEDGQCDYKDSKFQYCSLNRSRFYPPLTSILILVSILDSYTNGSLGLSLLNHYTKTLCIFKMSKEK